MSVGVIVNPVAGSGRMRREWPEIRTALTRHLGEITIEETRSPGDASALARKLAMSGTKLVVAVGGDGTISETADGLLQARAEAGVSPDLGIVPVGTGSDLARSLGISGNADAIAKKIAGSNCRAIDAGRVDYVDDHGALASRHFINIASIGLSGATDRAVNAAHSGSRVGGKAVFLWHTVRQLIRYRFQTVRVSVDGGAPVEGRIALVAVANGRYFGGGMMIAPDAVQDDGLAEIVVVRGSSKLTLLSDLRLVYSGKHRGHKSCSFMRGRTVTIEPVGDVIANGAFLDIDGESPGRIPATFEMMPKALTMRI